MNLNAISLAIYNAGRALFSPQWLFRSGDTGSYYKFTVPSSLTNADAYHSTAAIYPVIDDGRGVVNLWTHTEDFTNPAYTQTRCTATQDASTPPSIALRVNKITEDATASSTHTLLRSYTPSLGEKTLSYYVKKGTREDVRVVMPSTWFGGSFTGVFFDLDAGTVAGVAGATDYGIESAGDYYRVWISREVTVSTAGSAELRLCSDSSTDSYNGDGSSYIYATAAMLNDGSTPEDYQANSYTLGGSLGTAGLFCDPTQQWSVAAMYNTFAEFDTLVAKAGNTAGNKTFEVNVATSGGQYPYGYFRGTYNNLTSAPVYPNTGSHNVVLLVWDGTTLKCYFNRRDPKTLTVGTAAEESQNITWFARNESSPTSHLQGYGLPLLMEARALTASEATQFMQYHCNRIGVEA